MVADGVFSGGGVRVIAFAGAIRAAEAAGYREWHELAGTSGGAIIAAALAAGYDAAGLDAWLGRLDLTVLTEVRRPRHLAHASNLLRHQALVRGRALHRFVEAMLEQAPRPAHRFGDLDRSLRVIATDLVHRRMVVFPDDAPRYLHRGGRRFTPEEMPIADAVRMSAGYPFMFAPVRLRDADTGKAAALVDGGVVSGFPVSLFDRPQPDHPTWGFRLIEDQPRSGAGIRGWRWPVDMTLAILESSIGAHDRLEAAMFSQRTINIPTGSIGPLRFTLTRAERESLVAAGRRAAETFFATDPSGRNTHGQLPAGPATEGQSQPSPATARRSSDAFSDADQVRRQGS